MKNAEWGLLRKEGFNCILRHLGPAGGCAGYSSGFDLRDSCSRCRLRRRLDLTLRSSDSRGMKNSVVEDITKVVAGRRLARGMLAIAKNFAVIMEAL